MHACACVCVCVCVCGGGGGCEHVRACLHVNLVALTGRDAR